MLKYEPAGLKAIRSLGKIETSMAFNHQLLAGNTQGSQMVKINTLINEDALVNAAAYLFSEYKALQCVLYTNEEEFTFYQQSDFSNIPVSVFFLIEGESWLELLEKEVNDIITPELSTWRLNAYLDSSKDESYLIATFHHSIVDGSGVIVFLNRLLQLLDTGAETKAFNTKTFPPAIDTCLKEKTNTSSLQKNEGSFKPDKIAYLDNSANLLQRKTKMEVVSLSSNKLYQFMDICKNEKMSINGALSSFLVRVCHKEGLFHTQVELKSAVSLRDLSAFRDDENHSLGCYITVSNSQFDLSKRPTIKELCKSYDAQLFRAMLKEVAFVNPLSNGDMKKYISGMRESDCFSQGIGITNAGLVKPRKYQNFDVLDWHTINNRSGGNVCVVLHVIQINNQLNLGFVYSTPILSEKKAKSITKSFRDEIDAFMAATNEEALA